MTSGEKLPDEETSDVYSLDLDAEDEAERDAVIRDAVEAVEKVSVSAAAAAAARGDAVERPVSKDPARSNAVPADAGREAMQGELEQLREEVAELREHSLRTMADFENYRKRQDRDRAEMRHQVLAEMLQEVLEVIDNLERALSVATGEGGDLKIGVEMILRQMRDLTRRYGVEEIAAVGRPFDPEVHEAVGRTEDPAVSEPVVIEELQRGYLLSGRLLRATRVIVAMPPPKSQSGTGSADEPSAGHDFVPGAD